MTYKLRPELQKTLDELLYWADEMLSLRHTVWSNAVARDETINLLIVAETDHISIHHNLTTIYNSRWIYYNKMCNRNHHLWPQAVNDIKRCLVLDALANIQK